jgi:hypothetical protein
MSCSINRQLFPSCEFICVISVWPSRANNWNNKFIWFDLYILLLCLCLTIYFYQIKWKRSSLSPLNFGHLVRKWVSSSISSICRICIYSFNYGYIGVSTSFYYRLENLTTEFPLFKDAFFYVARIFILHTVHLGTHQLINYWTFLTFKTTLCVIIKVNFVLYHPSIKETLLLEYVAAILIPYLYLSCICHLPCMKNYYVNQKYLFLK